MALQQLPASLLGETEIIPKVFVEPSTPGDEVTVTTRPQRQHEPHPSPTSESNRKESEWNQPPCLGDAVASQSLGGAPQISCTILAPFCVHMCVCVCVCMHMCMNVCLFVCVCASVCVHVCVFVFAYVFVHVHVYV